MDRVCEFSREQYNSALSVQNGHKSREPGDRSGKRTKCPRPLTPSVTSDRTRCRPRHQQRAHDTDENASVHEEQSRGAQSGHRRKEQRESQDIESDPVPYIGTRFQTVRSGLWRAVQFPLKTIVIPVRHVG